MTTEISYAKVRTRKGKQILEVETKEEIEKLRIEYERLIDKVRSTKEPNSEVVGWPTIGNSLVIGDKVVIRSFDSFLECRGYRKFAYLPVDK